MDPITGAARMSYYQPATIGGADAGIIHDPPPGALWGINDRIAMPPTDVPPEGPPGFEGEWNPPGGPGSSFDTPPFSDAPVDGATARGDHLRLMLAIARALGTAIDGSGVHDSSPSAVADALRGLANLLDPPVMRHVGYGLTVEPRAADAP
ncbi:MAG: hypothetical protein KDC46_07815 [Thermoleophilia bacterium]|nr:hypothetical protein [Thermoleophilia bacterium]